MVHILYETPQLLFLTTHYENTNDHIDEFPLYSTMVYYTEEASI